jgi:hypothetical protein
MDRHLIEALVDFFVGRVLIEKLFGSLEALGSADVAAVDEQRARFLFGGGLSDDTSFRDLTGDVRHILSSEHEIRIAFERDIVELAELFVLGREIFERGGAEILHRPNGGSEAARTGGGGSVLGVGAAIGEIDSREKFGVIGVVA